MTKKMRGLNKSTLYRMWRKAVVARRGEACLLCGQPAGEIHHIIHQSHSALLKYDVRNGAPLCHACHSRAHTLAGLDELREVIGDDWAYLAERENKLKRDELLRAGQSEREWRREVKEKLAKDCT